MLHLLKKLQTLLKSLLIYGGLFVVISLALDWYRKPSQPANFAQHIFTDIHGQPVSLVQMSAQETMALYFWADWCGYCRLTSPTMERLRKDGTPVLSVAMNSGDTAHVAQYLSKNAYHFRTINDENGTLSAQWGVVATPTILFIKNGKIIHHTTGLSGYWGLKTRMMVTKWVR